MPKIRFSIITLFPEALKPYLDSSMLYKAQERGIIAVELVNLRDFGLGPHKSVDDTPYGGGDGMLLRCEPVFAAVENIKAHSPNAEVILPTPVGTTWNQALARQFAEIAPSGPAGDVAASEVPLTAENPDPALPEAPKGSKSAALASLDSAGGEKASNSSPAQLSSINALEGPSKASERHFIIICPHYEGYDERIMTIVDHPISLGNYVLTGGELPALILVDSISRLLPGVLGGATSAEIESFSDGDNLEYPQYTKPADFRGLKVPDILLSGHHANIAAWRAEQSRLRSKQGAYPSKD